jgi:Glyoxalase-like domain
MDEQVWFGAGSQAEAAGLVGAVVAELPDGGPVPDMEVRGDGVRVRVAPGSGDAVARAARTAGLVAVPGAVQELRLRVDASGDIARFWRAALHYEGDRDRLRRCPEVLFEHSGDSRPLRNRIHVDSGHPGPVAATVAALTEVGGRERFACEWYSTMADADGNEIDVVPGGPLEKTEDWRAMFGGMVCYPGASPGQAAELAQTAARLADDAGIPLMIDVRPEAIVLDSGKDEWERLPGFADLAADVERAARALGLRADDSDLRFVQTVIDAVDIPAVSDFWQAVLGYVPAPTAGVTDLFDPRQLNPVVIFQPMDATESDRRRQRNRTSYELLLPEAEVGPRVAAAVAAGGTVLDGTRLADPEGNEVLLSATVPQS